MNDQDGSQLVQRANADMTAAEDALAGGSDQRQAVLNWAKTNLSTADRLSYEQALQDPNTHRAAFGELVQRRSAASPAKPFASRDEYLAARRRRASTDNDTEYDRRMAATPIETIASWEA